MKNAFIDMDGTIADYYGHLRSKLEEMASPDEPEIPRDLHAGPKWITKRSRVITSKSEFWETIPPIKLGFTVTEYLNRYFDIHILTKGPCKATCAWTAKFKWCKQYLPEAKVTITEDKSITQGEVLFDDFPPYVDKWLKTNPNGKALMLSNFWNENFNHPRVMKVSSIKDINKINKFLGI